MSGNGGMMLNLAFGICFVLWSAIAIERNARRKPERPQRLAWLMTALQSALFLSAMAVALRHDAFSRALFSPVWISLGLVSGHLAFAVSLWATHGVGRDAARHLVTLPPVWAFLVEVPGLLGRFLSVAIAEEVIYRAAAQTLLIKATGHAALGIAVAAVIFALAHRHFFENTWAQSIEFLGFALAIGALYHGTGSLILVIMIHWVRNLESAYLEYLLKVEELGGETGALEALERQYAKKPVHTL